MNYDQLYQLARQAGFDMNAANIAAAVALAESDGDPRAHNDDPPDDSYGLWQINMLGAKGPERRRALGLTSNAQLFDPAINAKAAKYVFDAQGWNAWSVYKNGDYKKHLQDINDMTVSGLPGTTSGPIGDAIDNVFGAASDVVGALNQLLGVIRDAGKWISDRDNWTRILQVGGGIALALVAATIVAKPIISSTAKTVSPI